MRIYECTNCHSLFIINETDPRVQSGDYCFLPGELVYCALCSADMIKVDRKQEEEDEEI
jgi:DNA-directed RNA polymerase subunit RPC12/RpoP